MHEQIKIRETRSSCYASSDFIFNQKIKYYKKRKLFLNMYLDKLSKYIIQFIQRKSLIQHKIYSNIQNRRVVNFFPKISFINVTQLNIFFFAKKKITSRLNLKIITKCNKILCFKSKTRYKRVFRASKDGSCNAEKKQKILDYKAIDRNYLDIYICIYICDHFLHIF